MAGYIEDPVTSVQKACNDGDPCLDRTYTVAINVNERFVKLPLAEQKKRVAPLALWYVGDLPDKDGQATITYALVASLHGRVLGELVEGAWVWEPDYVAAINRRALK
jgi:hypothetical protein